MPNIDQLTEEGWTEDDFTRWSFAHAADHRDIDRVILRTLGIRVVEYVLDPFRRDDSSWLYRHQAMHDQMNNALDIQGYDLLSIDWRDPQDVIRWMNDNGDNHDRARTLLNL